MFLKSIAIWISERSMKLIFIASILVMASAGLTSNSLVAQESERAPRKFAEYSKCKTPNSGCENDESEWALLDAVGNLLKADLGVSAYVIGYSSRESDLGHGMVHANYVRNLLRRWVAEDSRVRAVYGGRRETLTIEVWIVRDFSLVPQPTPTITSNPENVKVAQKFYTYQFPYVDPIDSEMFSEYEYLNQGAILDGLAVMLEKNPGLQTYLIAYDGRLDRKGTAQKLAERDRYYLAIESNIPGERIHLINGGRREHRMVELWIASSDAAAPKATPGTQKRTIRKS
jgi:hypothetical protein